MSTPSTPRKLLLKNALSPGDIVLLTAAVRDLHRCYPGRFVTDVRTTCADLWDHNPYLTPLDEQDPEVEPIACRYPLINHSNKGPYHCLYGFSDFLNHTLGLRIRQTEFRGDIHLSRSERHWPSQVAELAGCDLPFWIVVAGGKYDATVKWWPSARYQAVVDHFVGRLAFVQIGELGHHHPRLNHAIDLRGRTSLRQLVRLVYHAQGVLCPVTCLMHLAAAVEVRPDRQPVRPCVVIAGGREPVHWEAYPHHEFIHTVGALACCRQGGCWRSRTAPLGDDDPRDRPEHLCQEVVHGCPRCLDMITPAEVIERIERYHTKGCSTYLQPSAGKAARRAINLTFPNAYDDQALNPHNARSAADNYLQRIPPYPQGYRGRGVVICVSEPPAIRNAWRNINHLRQTGCQLPIELWHLGPAEPYRQMASKMSSLGVQSVDARRVRQRHPVRLLRGPELKAYALRYCRFREVLLFDADPSAGANPEALFETPEYRRAGAIFWPANRPLRSSRAIWRLTGIRYRPEASFDSRQLVLDKERCWLPLCLCLWYNENSDFFLRYLNGISDTFYLAFRKLGQPYAMQTDRHTLRV